MRSSSAGSSVCRVLKLTLRIAPVLVLCPLLSAQVGSRAADIQAARARKAQSLEPDETSGTERSLIHFKDAKILERISAGIAGFRLKLGGFSRNICSALLI